MLLNIEKLTKTYTISGEKRHVLNGVDLQLGKGDIVSITGRSGCGKTTLLNVIAGLVRPDSGIICFNDRKMSFLFDLFAARFRNRHVGLIYQTFRLVPSETVMANVLLPARIAGKVNKELKQYIHEILGKLMIYKYRNTKTALLSGGQKQRVAIARSLVNNPDIILADEPTANLDKSTSNEIFNILESFRNEGKGIIIITHKDYMHKRSDTVYLMDNGVIEQLK